MKKTINILITLLLINSLCFTVKADYDENINYYITTGYFEENLGTTSEIGTNDDETFDLKNSLNNLLQEEHVEFELQTESNTDSKTMTLSSRPNPTKPSIISKGTVVGISDSSMDIFNGSNWVNTSNQCGAYAAGVMITYMDKYHGALWFKVHDNWSGNKHRGWINKNWIYKGVYTN